MKLFQGGTSAFDVPNIVTKPFFDTFVYLGGSGATLAFLVVVLLVAKVHNYAVYLAYQLVQVHSTLTNQ